MALKVSQVAKLAGVSVRALHHYDAIGLVCPSGRSEAGYRLYESRDLQRLQQALFFKELGFPLEEICRILRDPAFDLRAALRLQRELLEEKSLRLRALLEAVDRTLESIERGTTMSDEEMLEVFGDFDPKKYEEEARQRWGGTDAWKESKRRTTRYGKEEWSRIRDEGDAINRELAAAMDAGVAPTDPRAMDLAERHRQYISRWFYDCPRQMHRCLGEMYVADARFTETYERVHPGLAQYFSAAIAANAER